MRGHFLFQGRRRIADIKMTGLTLSLVTSILLYIVNFLWVIERVVFDEKVAELPIFEVDE